MKLNLSKEWLMKRAEQEEKAEVSAGRFHMNMLVAETKPAEAGTQGSEAERDNPRPAFGTLINLWRRRKRLRMDQLAERADIDLAELIAIERDIRYTPEPRTVYQLARTLALPSDRMLQLSGNTIVRDSHLGEKAVRFAARAESVEKLSKDEQRALEEFVKYLNEG